MKIAIAQSGPESAGKTTTIRTMYETLVNRYPGCEDEQYRRGNGLDIRAVLNIRGIRVGIESQGDPWKLKARLKTGLALFIRLKCDVIVCACRTRGGTVDAVSALEPKGYEVIWRRRTREAGEDARRAANRAEARWMVKRVEDLLAAEAA